MKLTKKVIAPVVAMAMMASSTVCVSAADEAIELTLWGAEEDQNLLKDLVAKFEETYSDYKFNIQIGVESESTAKDTILTDVEAAADVFAFASDQIYDLVNAGALANLDEYDAAFQQVVGKSLDDVRAANSESSVAAATVDGNLYAFPMAGDNSYFLYYDSSVVSAEEAGSWDTLLEAAGKAGKKVGMTLSSGWYNAGFFYGAGFTTSRNADQSTNMDWNGISEKGISGVDVVKSMLNIAGNSAFQAVADGDLSNQINGGGLCAVISGTWDAQAVQGVFGDGYAATKLPTFTVGDEQVQMGSAFGYKFIGVNAYAENIGWAAVLAEFLTNEEAQTERFAARQIGPTNLNAVSSDAVQENLAIAAVIAQSEFGVIQEVGGKYWDPTATFGENIAQGKLSADDDEGIQKALDTLVEGVTAPVE
ncbi:MAG: extracellular solute-binding protein [Lachnospiraceae bacterium]|nr:extracellular solute-binding protein [Robinsoniella sp.]MDY3766894.1 extracellular solute-binding protein [Lachnospiraceae bacterium]